VNSVAYSPARDQLIHELQYGGDGRPNIIPWIMTAVNGMRRNASSELATLSGGEYTNFVTQKGLEQALSDVANHIHDHYELSFQPPAASRYGFHTLCVMVRSTHIRLLLGSNRSLTVSSISIKVRFTGLWFALSNTVG
jgi:hypothetical protein